VVWAGGSAILWRRDVNSISDSQKIAEKAVIETDGDIDTASPVRES
jgi:hypothetical protein